LGPPSLFLPKVRQHPDMENGRGRGPAFIPHRVREGEGTTFSSFPLSPSNRKWKYCFSSDTPSSAALQGVFSFLRVASRARKGRTPTFSRVGQLSFSLFSRTSRIPFFLFFGAGVDFFSSFPLALLQETIFTISPPSWKPSYTRTPRLV